MSEKTFTSMNRLLTTLSFEEPDRVPLFLPLTMQGATELGISIKEYFSKAENVIEGQIRMREKYRHDSYYTFMYAAIEVEAMGSEIFFRDDGPPTSESLVIKDIKDIENLSPPHIENSPSLQKILETTKGLKESALNEVPIIGVVMSPFSLPIMQMGFGKYIHFLYEEPRLFEQLMTVNEDFCVNWANAQLEAGATAICYFDPVSSTSIIPREKYLETGFSIARRTLSRIKGPTVTHMASGLCLPIVNELIESGTEAVGVSTQEDMEKLKKSCHGKLTLLGNLNSIEMRRWTVEETENIVKEAIKKGAPGGGFILSDNHGEIPWQVPEEILMAISKALHKWGNYPISI